MKSLEQQPLTLDGLDHWDSIVCGDLQGLAELAGQNNPSARQGEPAANGNYRRQQAKSRCLFLLQWLRPLFCDPDRMK